MSSLQVRTEFKDYIAAQLPTEELVDLTGEYRELNVMVSDMGLTGPWLGVQFVGNEEIPISVHGQDNLGLYREVGVVQLHVVAPTEPDVATGILTRSELIRSSFRGKRIGQCVIESVTPANFGVGATLDFDGGFTSASIMLAYYRDISI